MKQRILSIILTLTILCTFIPCTYADTIINSGTCGDDGDNVSWVLDSNGTLSIFGDGRMADFNVGTPWEDLNPVNVIIEDGITYIGYHAFYYINSIKSVDIPNTVREIGSGAFAGTQISKIIIPDSVHSIGKELFRQCWALSDVTLSENLAIIPSRTFYDCSLENIVIPKKVSTIGEDAFCRVPLKNVTLPQSLMILSTNAFDTSFCIGWIVNGIEYCGIENVYYGGNEKQWENIDYRGSNSLLDAQIHYANSKSGGKCGDNAYWSIENKILKIYGTGEMHDYYPDYPLWLVFDYNAIEISEGITNISYYAFDELIMDYTDSAYGYDRYSFSRDHAKCVSIPKSVKSIDSGAFNKLNQLTDVYYAGSEQDWNNITKGGENGSLLNAEIHYNSNMPDFYEPLKVNTEYVVGNGKAIFTVTAEDSSLSDELDGVTLYVAEYDKNGSLINVYTGVNSSIESGSIKITADLPDTNDYKFMLWDEYQRPLMNAITGTKERVNSVL